jgi:uncharacterized protein YjiS (DUF1127 family)
MPLTFGACETPHPTSAARAITGPSNKPMEGVMAHAMQMGRTALREQEGRNPLDIGRNLLRSLTAAIDMWRQRTRLREELCRFDDRLLEDVGLDRNEVMHEVHKPFWQPCTIRRSIRLG